MPRFFFHTIDGGRHRDPDGTECEDLRAARREAIRYGGAVLHDEPDLLLDERNFRVEVMNEYEEMLFTVVTLTVDKPIP